MTTIKATCPTCGEVSLAAEDILLRIGTGGSSSTYGFSCPECKSFVEKPADERVVRLLLSGGVLPTMVNMPAEALETKLGPPLDYDDLLSFHELLERDDLAGARAADMSVGPVQDIIHRSATVWTTSNMFKRVPKRLPRSAYCRRRSHQNARRPAAPRPTRSPCRAS